MVLPDEAKKMGAPPNWMIYVGTPNVDDTAQRVAQLRGRVLKQPADIPGTGRFAVVQDPYGATFGLYTPKTPGPAKRAGRGRLVLVRALHAQPRRRMELLSVAVRMGEDVGDGHGRDGRLPDVRPRRRHSQRRHHEAADGRAGGMAALRESRRRQGSRGHRTGRRRQDRQRPDGSSRRRLDCARHGPARRDVRGPLVEAGREGRAGDESRGGEEGGEGEAGKKTEGSGEEGESGAARQTGEESHKEDGEENREESYEESCEESYEESKKKATKRKK